MFSGGSRGQHWEEKGLECEIRSRAISVCLQNCSFSLIVCLQYAWQNRISSCWWFFDLGVTALTWKLKLILYKKLCVFAIKKRLNSNFFSFSQWNFLFFSLKLCLIETYILKNISLYISFKRLCKKVCNQKLFTCSKLTIETLEQSVKYVQS